MYVSPKVSFLSSYFPINQTTNGGLTSWTCCNIHDSKPLCFLRNPEKPLSQKSRKAKLLNQLLKKKKRYGCQKHNKMINIKNS